MGNYLTVSEYREITNIQDSEISDTAIDNLINISESYINEILGNRYLYNLGEVTDYMRGSGDNVIFTPRYPVQSISYIGVDYEGDGTYTEVISGDYTFDSDTGKITLLSESDVDYFPNIENGVKITYTVGMVTPPDFIKSIIIRMVTNLLEKNKIDEGLQGEIDNLRDYKISLV